MRLILLSILVILTLTACATPSDNTLEQQTKTVVRANWYHIKDISNDAKTFVVTGEGVWRWDYEASLRLGINAITRRCSLYVVYDTASYRESIVTTREPCYFK
jgi:hypothetical protein